MQQSFYSHLFELPTFMLWNDHEGCVLFEPELSYQSIYASSRILRIRV
jgi:hypothetical protein